MPEIGTPITVEQATRAVLRLLNTPLIPADLVEGDPGHALSILKADDRLSGGEKALVDIAHHIWTWTGTSGRLGEIDLINRRKVIMVLAYLHLGHASEVELEAGDTEWQGAFGRARS